MTDQGATLSGPLPAAVRAKMIALAADALPRMPATQIPPSLRRSAQFAPAKRARLVGSQIAAAVEGDDTFRDHLAIQARALQPSLTAALAAGTGIGEDRLVEAAALAFIARPDGWVDIVEKARAIGGPTPVQAGQTTRSLARLEADLTAARGQVKAVRERFKAQVATLKADNAQLRRTLGQTRQLLKESVAQVEEVDVVRDRYRAEAAVVTRDLEAEIRRLRARVADLEAETATTRRTTRDERDAETMRLRLLLDTVTESAAGLRRELALPPSSGLLPAETVAALPPGSPGAATSAGAGLQSNDPTLLRRLLEIPRVHLIIDGYNVSKAVWAAVPLDQQRSRLTSGVAALIGGRGVECTVVFDGADLDSPPVVSTPRGVRVLFSPPHVTADDVIRDLVEAEPPGRFVVVVSTDREVAESVTRRGARSVASAALIGALRS